MYEGTWQNIKPERLCHDRAGPRSSHHLRTTAHRTRHELIFDTEKPPWLHQPPPVLQHKEMMLKTYTNLSGHWAERSHVPAGRRSGAPGCWSGDLGPATKPVPTASNNLTVWTAPTWTCSFSKPRPSAPPGSHSFPALSSRSQEHEVWEPRSPTTFLHPFPSYFPTTHSR